MLRDFALRALRRMRRANLVRPTTEAGNPELRAQIDALGMWFHNIEIEGTPTKTTSFMGESLNYPEALWNTIAPVLPPLSGKSVLDIGCNAGYFSIACKRLGARRVVGIDIGQGTRHDVLAQARFAARALDLDIEYRRQDFFDVADGPYDLVLFLGVLYHVEDPIQALRTISRLTRDTLVVESLITGQTKSVIEFRPTGTSGDLTTRWVPSARLIDELLTDVGFPAVKRLPVRTGDRYLAVAEKRVVRTAAE